MSRLGFLGRDDAIDAPPRPHDALHVCRRAGQRDVQQLLFGFGRGHTRDGAHLGVRDPPAPHRIADERQSW
jgi:hypothetical protein